MGPFDNVRQRCRWAWTLRTTSIAALLCCAPAHSIPAQEASPPPAPIDEPQFEQMRIGWGTTERYFRTGCWTPVSLTIRGGTKPVVGRLEWTVADGDGVPSTLSVERPVQLNPGQRVTVRGYIKPGRFEVEPIATLRAPATQGGRPIFRKRMERHPADQPLMATERLWVSAGPDVGLMSTAALIQRSTENVADSGIYISRLEDFSEFPARWFGLDGVEWVILSMNDPELNARISSSSAWIDALDEWVQRGGRLLLLAGRESPQLIGPGRPLERFSPGRFERMVTLRVFGAVEQFAGSTVPVAGVGAATAVQVPLLSELRGTVEAAEGSLPLVVRRAHGFGQIVFAGLDLDDRPWRDWKARERLLSRLLGIDVDQMGEPGSLVSGFEAGYSDISGQLRSALDEFSDVQIAPFWLVAALVLVYILWIGPIDYFLVKRVFRRTELTWITFPLAVVLFSVGIYVLARAMKGNDLLVNQVSLLDVDAERNWVRGTTWLNVFSPRVATYEVEVVPRLPDGQKAANTDRLISWQGLPGSGMGGMQSAAVGTPLWGSGYRYGPDLSLLSGVPIQVWSTKAFVSRWSAAQFEAGRALEARLEDDAGYVAGTVTNRLDVPLEDCLLAFGRWVYRLQTLEPGETVELDPLSDPRPLEAELTGRKVSEEDSATPTGYDLLSRNVRQVLRQMMFYDAAGGAAYTRLHHRYQRFIDLSELLELDRAIFIGFIDEPAVETLIDDQPQTNDRNRNWTCLRVVLPLDEL